ISLKFKDGAGSRCGVRGAGCGVRSNGAESDIVTHKIVNARPYAMNQNSMI
ncbi:hypothetical protein L9F63_025190, partial [Diploptera punctata]